jgi:hypothetical protein
MGHTYGAIHSAQATSAERWDVMRASGELQRSNDYQVHQTVRRLGRSEVFKQ